jgi:hypothetical protein
MVQSTVSVAPAFFLHNFLGSKVDGSTLAILATLESVTGFATQCRFVPKLGRFSPVGWVTRQKDPISWQSPVTIQGPVLNQTYDWQAEWGYGPE